MDVHRNTCVFKQPLRGVRAAGATVSSVQSPKTPVPAPPVPENRYSTTSPPDNEPKRPPADDVALLEQALLGVQDRLSEMHQQRQQALDELQQVAVELAVAVASQVLHEHINSDDYSVQSRVEHVISQVQASSSVTIRLHPDDLRRLGQQTAAEPPTWAGTTQLVPDATLSRGDCRVNTDDVSFLSKVDLQISELRQHLLQSLENAQIERRGTSPASQNLRRYPDRRESA